MSYIKHNSLKHAPTQAPKNATFKNKLCSLSPRMPQMMSPKIQTPIIASLLMMEDC